ncbi:MAG: hypothetical protein ACH254_20735 [Candidatus Thiodiazotropha endolucinida]
MEVKYVAVYKLRGANGLSGDDPLGLCEDENPNITATLTANSEPYFEHIDRSHALVSLLFRGLFGDSKEGSPEERLAVEIARIQTERQEKQSAGVYLVFEGYDEIDPPDFKTRKDRDDFAVSLDDVPKGELRKPFKASIECVLVGAALGLPTQADKKLEEIGSVLYLVDPDKGIPIYPFNFEAGRVGAYVSSPVGEEFAAEVAAMAAPLAADPALERPVRLLLSSLQVGTDSLPAFISAWSALEIFVNATFKSRYERQWFAIMEEGAPESSTPIFERFKDVMQDKYRIVDKFMVISAILDPDGANEDVKSFKPLKEIRDNMFHKFDSIPDYLPVENVQALFVKLLKLHLQGNTAEVV